MRRLPVLLAALAALATVVPLAPEASAAPTTTGGAVAAAPPSTAARVGVPQNIYAIGDSITTATGTAALGDEHPANSWVTGTNPSSFPDGRSGSAQVLSMRHRLGIAQGSAVNLAQNGKRMQDFDDQANRLPSSAQYVVVLLGGNDLCRPSVAEMTSEASYRSSFRAGLAAVQARAPNALIFVSSIPDVYNLWYLRKGSLKARTFWDNPTGFVIPCESLLQNPGSTSSADETRRRQVRTRTIAFNRILEDECALVLRCRFDGHGLFRRTSNRVDPFSNTSAYLPESQWGFRDQDISHDQGTWGFLCPANFNYSGCGDHFHPSHWGQAKLAAAGHDFSYRFQADGTAPTATITPSRGPDGDGVYARSVDVTFGGTDANGVRGQEVRVQGPDGVLGPWQPSIGTAPARTISAIGTTYVQVRTLDRNGNLSASTTRSITIDPNRFGGVSGTVRGPAGPLSGIEVSLHAAAAPGALATVTTGPDGSYGFPELLAGDEVKVRAHDPSGVHVDQWYDGAATHDAATVITVPSDDTTVADLSLALTEGTLEGTVTGPSGPLAGITVQIHGTAAAGVLAELTTDGDGQWSIEGLPGSYKVRYLDPSWQHLGEWHLDAPTHGAATPVSVVGGETTTVDATLVAFGSLQGTVTGPGGPLAGITVQVHGTGALGRLAQVTTDADGQWSVVGLPGSYKLRYLDPTGVHLSEWHLDAPNHGAATPVSVVEGQATTVDATMILTPGILDGTVSGPSGPLAGIVVQVHRADAPGLVAQRTTGADGRWSTLAFPGSYKLRFVDPTGTHVGEWHLDVTSHGAATAVEVTRGQASTVDAQLALTPTP